MLVKIRDALVLVQTQSLNRYEELVAAESMSIMLIYMLFMALLGIANTQDQQCHIPGECTGVLLTFTGSTSYNDCLNSCNSNSNCNYFTYLGDDAICVHFNDCPDVSDTCGQNCFSGEKTCPKIEPTCFVQGTCNGHPIYSNHSNSAQDCLKECQAEPLCQWFTYNADVTYCYLMEDCLLLDDSCTNCISGERDCQLAETNGNKLFAVGGIGAPYHAEVVDFNEQNSTCPNISESPFENGAVGTFINDVIVCGGTITSGITNKCYNYNPGRDDWTETFSMDRIRGHAAAVQLSLTTWWVTGGFSGSGYLSSTEMYTAGEGFSPYVDMPEGFAYHNLVKVNGTHVMLLGGSASTDVAWMFNAVTEEWTSLPNMLVSTSHTQAGLVTHEDGSLEVVVAAGRGTNATQIFSLDSMSWRLGPDFPGGALYDGSSVPYGNSFLVVAGYNNFANQKSIYTYELTAGGGGDGTWKELPQQLTRGRYWCAAFVVPDDFMSCI